MTAISAVVPTFDRHELLLAAIRSILAQTEPPQEIVVVDNGFSPVPERSLPADVRLIRIPGGAGVSAARNAGVSASRSEYVAFLDDDDRWSTTYLEEVRRAIARHPRPPDVILGNKHREMDGVVAPYKMIPTLEGLRGRLLYMNPGVSGQNLTVARAFHVERHRGFRTSLRASEDRAYLIDAIDAGAEICLAPDAIVVKVMHPGDQLTDRPRLRTVLRFSATYWRSMDRVARVDNTRKVLHGIRAVLANRLRPQGR